MERHEGKRNENTEMGNIYMAAKKQNTQGNHKKPGWNGQVL